jgi:DNA invertase Pin-like site-specific DNA recombinase
MPKGKKTVKKVVKRVVKKAVKAPAKKVIKKAGAKVGKKSILNDAQIKQVAKAFYGRKKSGLTVREITEKFKISVPTLYKYMAKLKA